MRLLLLITLSTLIGGCHPHRVRSSVCPLGQLACLNNGDVGPLFVCVPPSPRPLLPPHPEGMHCEN